MRTFRCKLDFAKSTDSKYRWDEDIDGTRFSLYIPQWRVPDPTPERIAVRLHPLRDISSFDSSGALKKDPLQGQGLNDDHILEIRTWLDIVPCARPKLSREERMDPDAIHAFLLGDPQIRVLKCADASRPIVAIVTFYKEHTRTVRYTPILDKEMWEIGEPYVPKSELGAPYPSFLIMRVDWG